jgi:hypothetical protein
MARQRDGEHSDATCTFVVADWFGSYPGHTGGERRNGWVTPFSTENPPKAKRRLRDRTLLGLCKHCQHYPQFIMSPVNKYQLGDDTGRHAVRCIKKPCEPGDV